MYETFWTRAATVTGRMSMRLPAKTLRLTANRLYGCFYNRMQNPIYWNGRWYESTFW